MVCADAHGISLVFCWVMHTTQFHRQPDGIAETARCVSAYIASSQHAHHVGTSRAHGGASAHATYLVCRHRIRCCYRDHAFRSAPPTLAGTPVENVKTGVTSTHLAEIVRTRLNRQPDFGSLPSYSRVRSFVMSCSSPKTAAFQTHRRSTTPQRGWVLCRLPVASLHCFKSYLDQTISIYSQ